MDDKLVRYSVSDYEVLLEAENKRLRKTLQWYADHGEPRFAYRAKKALRTREASVGG